jgi:hypothetical protein
VNRIEQLTSKLIPPVSIMIRTIAA